MNGARRGIRTPDILITNQVLYQLSYAGLMVCLRLSYAGNASAAL